VNSRPRHAQLYHSNQPHVAAPTHARSEMRSFQHGDGGRATPRQMRAVECDASSLLETGSSRTRRLAAGRVSAGEESTLYGVLSDHGAPRKLRAATPGSAATSTSRQAPRCPSAGGGCRRPVGQVAMGIVVYAQDKRPPSSTSPKPVLNHRGTTRPAPWARAAFKAGVLAYAIMTAASWGYRVPDESLDAVAGTPHEYRNRSSYDTAVPSQCEVPETWSMFARAA
jgi:hypothetical protein